MAPRAKKAVTIYQVAQRAAVSPATVSRVMNGIAVDPVLAERVRRAAAELDFAPSQTAINLSRSRTQTVAMLVPDLANPTFQAILSGLDRAATRDGYWVLVADSHERSEDEGPLAREMRRRSDALVLCSPRMDTPALTELLPTLAPVTVINRFSAWLPAPVVSIDYRTGMRELVTALAGMGHRRLAFLEGNPRSASNEERRRGIEEALVGLPGVSVDSLPGGVGFSDGYEARDAVLASGATAALAFNDLVAMGLISALHEQGVQVPEQVTVTGFDDIPFAAFTTPPMTTVSTRADRLGEMAWDRIHAQLEGRAPEANDLLRPEVVLRGSSASPA